MCSRSGRWCSTSRISCRTPGWSRRWRLAEQGRPGRAGRPAPDGGRRAGPRGRVEGICAGRGHGGGCGLDRGHGGAAARRHGPAVRRGAGTDDVGHVPAGVEVRARPAVGRGRRPVPVRADRARRPDRCRGDADLRGHRRHDPADLRICQAGQRLWLLRGEGSERAAGHRVLGRPGAGDRGDPAAERIRELGPRRGPAGRRQPENDRSRAGSAGRWSCGRTAPTTAPT